MDDSAVKNNKALFYAHIYLSLFIWGNIIYKTAYSNNLMFGTIFIKNHEFKWGRSVSTVSTFLIKLLCHLWEISIKTH